MSEQWRDVIGFEGAYEVSDAGNVRSVSRTICCSNGSCRLIVGRILKPGNCKGYPIIRLSVDNHCWTVKPYHLVLEAFVGPRPLGSECRHFPDPDPFNCKLSNIQWGTRKENAADRKIHGTEYIGDRHWARADPERFRRLMQSKGWAAAARGEKVSGVRATEAIVVAIRAKYRKGSSDSGLPALAKEFNLNPSTVHKIVTRRTWRHVP